MKPGTEDQIKGAVHEAKGVVKEKAGQILQKPDLEAEGQDEKLAGTSGRTIDLRRYKPMPYPRARG